MFGLNQALLVVFALALAGGQLLFKRTADGLAGATGFAASIERVALSPSFYLALGLYAGSTLLWTWVLTRVPLSQAYPWAALGTAIVPLLAVLCFGERVRPGFWVGAALIMVGVVVTQRSAGSP